MTPNVFVDVAIHEPVHQRRMSMDIDIKVEISVLNSEDETH
jgi:hypothetical protein